MNLQFAISTMVYHHEDIKKLLPYLSKWKISNIEIRPHEGHFECQNPLLIDEIKKKIKHYNIFVKSIHMPMNDVDISNLGEYDRVKSVREIEKTILVALRLNSNLVIVHPGGKIIDENDKKKRLRNSIKSISEINEFGKKYNVKIAIENTVPGSLGDNLSEIKLILDEISSENLGVCLDIGHYYLNQKKNKRGEINLKEEPIDWQKDLFNLHIHDNKGEEDLHLLPEEGDIKWYSFINYLTEINYTGSLVIESKDQLQLNDYLQKYEKVKRKLESFLNY